jgi:hypothetical protein
MPHLNPKKLRSNVIHRIGERQETGGMDRVNAQALVTLPHNIERLLRHLGEALEK